MRFCRLFSIVLVLASFAPASGGDVTLRTVSTASFCGLEDVSCGNTSLEAGPREDHALLPTTLPPGVAVTAVSSTREPRNATTIAPGVRFCGVPDDPDSGNRTRRFKRYNTHGKKWRKTKITWTLRRSSGRADLSEGVIRQQLTAAMEVWQRESVLEFQEVHRDTKDVDIYVDFRTGDHGDNYNFDGKGGTLAHAFYPGPGIGGDVHFDDTENFVTHSEAKSYVSNSLLVTAAHELGHSLGLLHSDDPKALMAPFYQDFPEDFRLPDDDKYGIQAIYGRRRESYPSTTPQPRPPEPPVIPTNPPVRPPTRPPVTPPTRPPVRPPTRPPVTPPTRPPVRPPTRPPVRPPTRPPPKPPTRPPPTRPRPRPPTTPAPTTPALPPAQSCPINPPRDGAPPDACDTEFDAVTVFHGELYFFSGRHYWRMSREGRPYLRESPYVIQRRFHGLPRDVTRVDAAYENRDDNIVFFSGHRFFVLGYALQLRQTGSLTDLGVNATRVDAVMVWGHNGRTYLFSGDRYWRLDRQGRAENDYPRDVAVWRGLPHNISGAFTHRFYTYFLAGRVFWRFNNTAMRIVPSPFVISSHWFSCPYYDAEQIKRCLPSGAQRVNAGFLWLWAALGSILLAYTRMAHTIS